MNEKTGEKILRFYIETIAKEQGKGGTGRQSWLERYEETTTMVEAVGNELRANEDLSLEEAFQKANDKKCEDSYIDVEDYEDFLRKILSQKDNGVSDIAQGIFSYGKDKHNFFIKDNNFINTLTNLIRKKADKDSLKNFWKVQKLWQNNTLKIRILN